MADNTKLISDLPPLSELRDDDVLFCMRGSISYKLPGSVVKALALGGSAYIGYYGGVPYWYVYDPETGEHVRSEKAQGPEGPKITNAAVDDSYHLIITLDDGTEYDAGYVRGPGGAGTGDMLEEDYDPAGEVKAAGGIAQYINDINSPIESTSKGFSVTGISGNFAMVRSGNVVTIKVSASGTPTYAANGVYVTDFHPMPIPNLDGAEFPLRAVPADGAVFYGKLDGEYLRFRWTGASTTTAYTIDSAFTYIADPEG